MKRREDIRNIVIIAHVDHGKTSLVDCLLKQSGEFRDSELSTPCILDSNDIERERGITILAKNIAIPYKGVKINVIDTPGHADFGGEVERVLRMADGALLLIDAADGTMPQTRFVLSKALECGLQPIVVINKIDRPEARSHQALDEALELILDLNEDLDLDDFPHIFTSAKEGYSTHDPDVRTDSMESLLELVMKNVPGPQINEAPFQMLCTTLDWSKYVGRIAIGRIQSGEVKSGQTVALCQKDGETTEAKVSTAYVFENLGRAEVESASAGDVCALVGLEKIEIGDTICHREHPKPMPRVSVDEPTLKMVFSINSSPLVGKEGKFVTSRQLRERLYKELEKNVALRVEAVPDSDAYAVSGRGVLHLAVLIETMRREGYELSVGKPQVILRKINGRTEEPFESLVIEAPTEKMGPVMEMIGKRRGELQQMNARGEYTHATFIIPSRGLIGVRNRLLNATQGTIVMNHRFESYREAIGEAHRRAYGVLVSNTAGRAIAFGLNGLQQRAELFVGPGDDIYEGMIVGESVRESDVVVNPAKSKNLTNIRAAGTDENILLKPARKMSLEDALEYVEDDELVEITPTQIRLRKIMMKEADRRRYARSRA